MKEYVKPELIEISFASEEITVSGEQGNAPLSGFDPGVD